MKLTSLSEKIRNIITNQEKNLDKNSSRLLNILSNLSNYSGYDKELTLISKLLKSSKNFSDVVKNADDDILFMLTNVLLYKINEDFESKEELKREFISVKLNIESNLFSGNFKSKSFKESKTTKENNKEQKDNSENEEKETNPKILELNKKIAEEKLKQKEGNLRFLKLKALFGFASIEDKVDMFELEKDVIRLKDTNKNIGNDKTITQKKDISSNRQEENVPPVLENNNIPPVLENNKINDKNVVIEDKNTDKNKIETDISKVEVVNQVKPVEVEKPEITKVEIVKPDITKVEVVNQVKPVEKPEITKVEPVKPVEKPEITKVEPVKPVEKPEITKVEIVKPDITKVEVVNQVKPVEKIEQQKIINQEDVITKAEEKADKEQEIEDKKNEYYKDDKEQKNIIIKELKDLNKNSSIKELVEINKDSNKKLDEIKNNISTISPTSSENKLNIPSFAGAGSVLKTAAKYAGPAALIAGAGLAGAAIGTGIYNSEWYQRGMGDGQTKEEIDKENEKTREIEKAGRAARRERILREKAKKQENEIKKNETINKTPVEAEDKQVQVEKVQQQDKNKVIIKELEQTTKNELSKDKNESKNILEKITEERKDIEKDKKQNLINNTGETDNLLKQLIEVTKNKQLTVENTILTSNKGSVSPNVMQEYYFK